MSLRSKIVVGFASLSPVIASAGYLDDVATTFKKVIATVLPAFIGLAIIGFAYGLFVYLKGGAEDKEKGKTLIFWGGLSIVVLISLYGIAGLLQTLTGATGTIINVPSVVTGLHQ